MRKFVVVQDGRAHEILRCEDPPQFASYIQVREVPDDHPVQEGWTYDEFGPGFMAPPPPPPPPVPPAFKRSDAPPADRTVIPFNQDGVTCYGSVWARRFIARKGVFLHGHAHTYDHLSILVSGKVLVEYEDFATEYEGPIELIMRKNVKHKVTALTDDVVWFCIFAIRDADGNVVDCYTGEQDPIPAIR